MASFCGSFSTKVSSLIFRRHVQFSLPGVPLAFVVSMRVGDSHWQRDVAYFCLTEIIFVLLAMVYNESDRMRVVKGGQA